MTRPDAPTHHLDVDADREVGDVALVLAEQHIAHLEESLRVQGAYLADLTVAQKALVWAEAEREAALKALATERAGYAADIVELHAALTEMADRLAEAEMARDLAHSDLRAVLSVVELGLDLPGALAVVELALDTLAEVAA